MARNCKLATELRTGKSMWEMRRVPQPYVKKWVVFSLILVGNKHEIIITQEEISRREIVKVEFMGEKI